MDNRDSPLIHEFARSFHWLRPETFPRRRASNFQMEETVNEEVCRPCPLEASPCCRWRCSPTTS